MHMVVSVFRSTRAASARRFRVHARSTRARSIRPTSTVQPSPRQAGDLPPGWPGSGCAPGQRAGRRPGHQYRRAPRRRHQGASPAPRGGELDGPGYVLGTTLGLAYAQAHPDLVSALVLALLTTTSRREVEWLTADVGRIFPQEWDRFTGAVPDTLRHLPLVDAYAILLFDPDPRPRAQPALRGPAAPRRTGAGRHPGRARPRPLDVSSPLVTVWRPSRRWTTSRLHVLADAGHGGGDLLTSVVVEALARFAASAEARIRPPDGQEERRTVTALSLTTTASALPSPVTSVRPARSNIVGSLPDWTWAAVSRRWGTFAHAGRLGAYDRSAARTSRGSLSSERGVVSRAGTSEAAMIAAPEVRGR